jgi:uncharacterized Zn finger protein (UPF0148 family)
MKCPNCGKEYFDNGQIICEYCGNELISSQPNTQITRKTKLERFIEDSGIKEAYKKMKESLRKLKE